MSTAIACPETEILTKAAEKIQFIPNEEFPTLDQVEATRLPVGVSLYSNRQDRGLAAVTQSGDLSSLRTSPLLSSAGEAFLFRKMNYLKFVASRLQDSSAFDESAAQVHILLADADAVRNHIAECNLRLVISIARKFATSHSDFDEYVSEGNMILLKAIDKFDFSRGFRFSTYATHSVQCHFYRLSQNNVRRRKIELAGPAGLINELPETESTPVDPNAVEFEEQRLKQMFDHMDECLDDREQTIVRRRFGIGHVHQAQTLREVGQEIGVSKERVRQIQIAAIAKLRIFLRDLYPEFAA